jgi:hypothetical protein
MVEKQKCHDYRTDPFIILAQTIHPDALLLAPASVNMQTPITILMTLGTFILSRHPAWTQAMVLFRPGFQQHL